MSSFERLPDIPVRERLRELAFSSALQWGLKDTHTHTHNTHTHKPYKKSFWAHTWANAFKYIIKLPMKAWYGACIHLQREKQPFLESSFDDSYQGIDWCTYTQSEDSHTHTHTHTAQGTHTDSFSSNRKLRWLILCTAPTAMLLPASKHTHTHTLVCNYSTDSNINTYR